MIPYFSLTYIWLGGLRINMWGLMIALGLLVSLYLAARYAKRHAIPVRQVIDLGLFMFLGAIIVARLMYITFYEPAYFATYPLEIFAIWNGGLSSIGGIMGAVAVFFIFLHRKRGMWLRLADVFCYAWPAGWAIGRMGCFFVHDHPGTLSSSLLAVRFPDGPRLDMGLMEAILVGILAMGVFVTARKPQLRGVATAFVMVGYGIMRFIMDFYRAADISGADMRYFGLTVAQYASVLLVIIGTAIWFRRGTPLDADRHGVGVV